MAQIHDRYGKDVLRRAAPDAFHDSGSGIEVDYGSKAPARIDGVIGDIAVEIESRVSKQVRGALMDLICHRSPKKLLVLLPVHMQDPRDTSVQCRTILSRFLDSGTYEVVILRGSGDTPCFDEDVANVRDGLSRLGWSQPASSG